MIDQTKLRPTNRLLLGYPEHGRRLLSTDSDRHLITIAPAGTGKSVSSLVPNLLRYSGSAVVIDPKGELAAVTAAARLAMGHKVVLLNPFELHGLIGQPFNPLEWLEPSSPDYTGDVAALVDGLVVPDSQSSEDGHWDREAKELLSGLIGYIRCCQPQGKRSLADLRHLLRGGDFNEVLTRMKAATEVAQGTVAQTANQMLLKSEREFASVVSAANSHINFLKDPRIAASFNRSAFYPEELKERPTTIYLILPADQLAIQRPWLRLMLSMLIKYMTRADARGGPPVTFFLDEMAALGRLDILLQSYGLARGYGMRFWAYFQDLSQPKRIYGEGWETIMATSGVFQAFGVADHSTAKLLSEMLGKRTIVKVGFNDGQGSSGERENANMGNSYEPIGRELMTPDEIRRLPHHLQFLFVQGMAPLKSEKLNYLREPEYAGLYLGNPMHAA